MNDVNHAIVLETTFDRRYCSNDYRTATLQRITLNAISFVSNWQCGRWFCWGGDGVSVESSSLAAAVEFTEVRHGGHLWSAFVASCCVPFFVKIFNLKNALNFNLVAEIILHEFLRKKTNNHLLSISFLRGLDFANELLLSSLCFAKPLPSVRVPCHPTVLIKWVPS